MNLTSVVVTALALFLACVAGLMMILVIRWRMHIWLPDYFRASVRPRRRPGQRDTVHVMFALVDHFEPVVKAGQNPARKGDVMADWVKRYPVLASKHRDSDNRPPRHTWAYPLETYNAHDLDQLVDLCRAGLGEVEVHIHHSGDTSESFRAKMIEGLANFAKHGLCVARGVDGYRFGFVHGMWALDNSYPDGRCCGVNDELRLLRELGCFADATLPSAPNETQTRKINSIYYATDDPVRPKSHDTGVDVEVGRAASGDLMIIQGPLALDWSSLRFGILPGTDNANITGTYPGTPSRIDRWVRLGIGIIGRPDWVFVKAHCHGALAADREALLGAEADEMFTHLERTYGAGRYCLHYVTLREMYNIIKAAEAGRTGDPGGYRDFVIPPYVM